jgi:hypothetical protein
MPINLMRALAASSLGIASGLFGFTAGVGITNSWWEAALIGACAAGLVGWLVYARAIVPVDGSACSFGLKIVAGAATMAALVQLARLTVFIVDPSQTACSFVPSSTWETEHSCVSAYYIGGQAAPSAPDVYDNSLYSMPDDDPTQLRKARMIGPFKIDVYEYPPPFLLLPRTLQLLTPDFTHYRMIWFGFCGGVVLLAFVVVVRFMSPAAGTRALLLSPIVWLSFPMISNLQKGNAQATVIAASMLAMVLLARRREAAGGAILAFVAMSKIYPGMLVIYLLAQRRWRALAWTTGWGFVFLAVSFLDTGWAPYAAFLHHLPGILGGEAFPAFRNPAAMAINFSIPGLIFKLKLFGVPGMAFGASKIVGWAYTLVVIAATVVAGQRTFGDDRKPQIWMAILVLATLRSPFLPQAYAAIPPLWLLTLMAATVVPNARTLVMVVVTAAALNLYWPLDWPIDPRLLAVGFSVPQAITVVLAVLALRLRPGVGAGGGVQI